MMAIVDGRIKRGGRLKADLASVVKAADLSPDLAWRRGLIAQT